MAVRKSKEENFTVRVSLEDALKKCEQALNNGGFKKIVTNKLINQLTADYKKFSVWGEIAITLEPKEGTTNIKVVSTANTDNLFALFSSPNQKILSQFKDYLQ